MPLWTQHWRLAAIFIVVSLFFLTCGTTAQAADRGAPGLESLLSVETFETPQLLAQNDAPAKLSPKEIVDRGPGGYFSIIKLILVALVFWYWVFVSDRMNVDGIRFGEKTEMDPEIWNPINLGSFLVGFIATISIPIFLIGFPLYLIAAVTPTLVYFFMRRSKLAANERLAKNIASGKQALKSGGGTAVMQDEILPQDEGANVSFSPAGADRQAKQVNLIRARQGHGFIHFKNFVADLVDRRAETVLLDYTAQAVSVRLELDGVWQQLQPMDRQTGDALLACAKQLAGLNPQDRRGQQKGKFGFGYTSTKAQIEILSQGVQTGERVQIKFLRKSKGPMNLGEMGMWPEMFSKLAGHLSQPGLSIISAPAKHGLTTNWIGSLLASDRVTRDMVAFLAEGDTEFNIENISPHFYPAGESPLETIRKTMLTQPEGLVFPTIPDSATLDELTRLVVEEGRAVYTHLPSSSAAEAILRLYQMAGNKEQFAKAVTVATCQKLARRLCETCKQAVQAPPKLIQQLGGDPQKQNSLYNHFTGPPPGQVDEKGEPIVIPPCRTCSAYGYSGRIGYFEIISMTDQLRKFMLKNPDVKSLAAAAKKLGNPTLTEQAYRLGLVGLTSVAEIQRSLKS